MKYACIKAHSSELSVAKMSDLLGVSRSGYYDWLNRRPSRRTGDNAALAEEIYEIHKEFRGTYGSPRITDELHDRGLPINEKRVARIMRENGIKGCQTRKFRIQTTDSNHKFPVAPNLLNQNFHVSAPNKVWASDLTYVRYGESWGYLCAIQDLFNAEIVGWSFQKHMRTEMVLEAFKQAVYNRKPCAGVIFHSDRGSQYASDDFKKALIETGMIQSMSRKGNCYDNAPSESFFKTLKVEEVYRKKYKNFKEAKRNLFDYIEVFYKRMRKHSRLGYLTPAEYLRRYYVA